MTTRRGNRHQLTIDGQTIWLDSNNEELALTQFIEKYGFTGKWERPIYGIKHTGMSYTPDFILSINDFGKTNRALVEVKEYRQNFTKDMAKRMCATARHYNTDCLFVYATKKDEWNKVLIRTGILRPCAPPQPGEMNLSEMSLPTRFLSRNYHGRHYYQSVSDMILSSLQNYLSPSKQKRRKRRV